MEVTNLYKEKPEVPYFKQSIRREDVFTYIASLPYGKEVKRMVYAVSYNETAGFAALVNTNAAGIQADGGRWNSQWDAVITGTTVLKENMTGNARRFIVFDKWQSSIKMLAHYISLRGIYIGGNCKDWANIPTIKRGDTLQTDLYTAYLRAWVLGNTTAIPKAADLADFSKLYSKAAQLFI